MVCKRRLKLEILERLLLNKKGFSYLEALFTLLIFGISSTAILSLISNSFFISYNSDVLISANFLALKILEEAKYEIYYNFASSGISQVNDFWWLKGINTNPRGSFLGGNNFQTILNIETTTFSTRTATLTVEIKLNGKSILKLIQKVYCWHPIKCF